MTYVIIGARTYYVGQIYRPTLLIVGVKGMPISVAHFFTELTQISSLFWDKFLSKTVQFIIGYLWNVFAVSFW